MEAWDSLDLEAEEFDLDMFGDEEGVEGGDMEHGVAVGDTEQGVRGRGEVGRRSPVRRIVQDIPSTGEKGPLNILYINFFSITINKILISPNKTLIRNNNSV